MPSVQGENMKTEDEIVKEIKKELIPLLI